MQKYFPHLVYLILFLLPWQTRYIFADGVSSVYAVELLILGLFLTSPFQGEARWGCGLHIKFEHRPSVRLLGLLLVTSLVSVLLAINRPLAFYLWFHLLTAGALFLLLLDQRVSPMAALKVFVLGLIIPIVLGGAQVFMGTAPSSSWLGLAPHDASTLGSSVIEGAASRWLRAYGTFDHPNIFGGYVATGLLCILALLSRHGNFPFSRGNTKGLLLVPLCLFSFALVISFSRSAWLAFLLALFVSGALLLWKNRVRAQAALPFLSITLLLIGVFVGVLSDPVFSRFSPELRLESRSLTERVSEYQQFSSVFLPRPLFGTGVGGYTLALEKLDPGKPDWAYQPIHNTLLLVLAELGIFGAFFMLLFAASVDKINYASIRRGSVRAITAIGLGTILLVVALLDHYLWSTWSGLALFAFSIALTLRLSEN